MYKVPFQTQPAACLSHGRTSMMKWARQPTLEERPGFQNSSSKVYVIL